MVKILIMVQSFTTSFQLVLCMCNLFGSVQWLKSASVPLSFSPNQPSGTTTMLAALTVLVHDENQDEGLRTRLILAVKVTALWYFGLLTTL